MSRCKACDTQFSDSDFSRADGSEEDMCSYCRYVSSNPFGYSSREYQFEYITEVPIYVENYHNTIDK